MIDRKGGWRNGLDYFKDILFDLINESNDLDISKIDANDKEGSFQITLADGSCFLVRCEKA